MDSEAHDSASEWPNNESDSGTVIVTRNKLVAAAEAILHDGITASDVVDECLEHANPDANWHDLCNEVTLRAIKIQQMRVAQFEELCRQEYPKIQRKLLHAAHGDSGVLDLLHDHLVGVIQRFRDRPRGVVAGLLWTHSWFALLDFRGARREAGKSERQLGADPEAPRSELPGESETEGSITELERR